jgi:hypothetical protein
MRTAILGLLLLSCTKTPAPQPTADSKPAVQPTVASAKAKLDSCRAVGPVACDMPPRPTPELCQPAHSCLRKLTADDISVEGLVIECDADPTIEPLDTGFSKREPAPTGSGVTATTVVDLRSTEDRTSMFEASYLIAEFAEGSCIVDIVHRWEMSRLIWETGVATRWDEGFVLRLDATRVLYDEPDEGVAPKEPYCERLSYRVTDGRFTRLGRESSAGACPGTKR